MKKKHQPGCPCCECTYWEDTFLRTGEGPFDNPYPVDPDDEEAYTVVSGDWSIKSGGLLAASVDGSLITFDTPHPSGSSSGVLALSTIGDGSNSTDPTTFRILLDYVDVDNYKFVEVKVGGFGLIGDPVREGYLKIGVRASGTDSIHTHRSMRPTSTDSPGSYIVYYRSNEISVFAGEPDRGWWLRADITCATDSKGFLLVEAGDDELWIDELMLTRIGDNCQDSNYHCLFLCESDNDDEGNPNDTNVTLICQDRFNGGIGYYGARTGELPEGFVPTAGTWHTTTSPGGSEGFLITEETNAAAYVICDPRPYETANKGVSIYPEYDPGFDKTMPAVMFRTFDTGDIVQSRLVIGVGATKFAQALCRFTDAGRTPSVFDCTTEVYDYQGTLIDTIEKACLHALSYDTSSGKLYVGYLTSLDAGYSQFYSTYLDYQSYSLEVDAGYVGFGSGLIHQAGSTQPYLNIKRVSGWIHEPGQRTEDDSGTFNYCTDFQPTHGI